MPTIRTTRISFSVPSSYRAPEWYSTAEPTEIADALNAGAAMYETLRSLKSTTEIQAIEAQKAAEIAVLKERNAEQIASLQAELDKTLAEKTSTAQRMQELLESQRIALNERAAEQISALQTELDKAMAEKTAAAQRMQELLDSQRIALESTASKDKERIAAQHAQRLSELQSELVLQQERYAALLERRQQLESGRDADIRLAEERTKVLLQHALDEKEKSILRAEKMFHTLHEAYEKQSEELKTLGDLLRKKPSTNAKTKGSDFEEEFRTKLIAVFGVGEGFALSDSSKSGIGHAGDSVMKWGEHYVLWEVKNYDRPVPNSEVEKFKRDMRENAQVRVGVMISRCTAITGKNASGDRDIEFVDGKMLLYFSNFESMSEDTLPNLLTLFRLWWKIDQTTASSMEDESKEQTIRQINKLHEDACRAKNEWRVHKSRMEEAMRWMAERVDETESRLKSALNIIQGCVTSVALPEDIFREVHGDPAMMKDAQTIMKFTSVETGGSLVLNDLAELFSKERALSRDAAKSHIRQVLLDKVLETQKGKSTRVIGLVLKPATDIATASSD